MKLLIRIIILTELFTLSSLASANAPVRYALIIGNNRGNTPSSVTLPDLEHAEAEARKVRDRLIDIGNFSQNQVALVTGKDREQILKAAKKLANRHKKDRKKLGSVPTLFLFYYTGHGLEGKLLTSGDPLNGEDLGNIFEEFDATFTVGVFDACFSGNLDLKRLRSKGIRVLHGFNVFEQLSINRLVFPFRSGSDNSCFFFKSLRICRSALVRSKPLPLIQIPLGLSISTWLNNYKKH